MKKKDDIMLEEKEEKKEKKTIEAISPWTIGNEYSTRQDLYVWKDAGENKKEFDDLPDKLKAICSQDEFGKAIINSGARIVVEDVKETDGIYWAKINGGWICGKNSKLTYVS